MLFVRGVSCLQETHHKEFKQLIDKLEKQGEFNQELIEQNKALIEEFKEIKKEKVCFLSTRVQAINLAVSTLPAQSNINLDTARNLYSLYSVPMCQHR